MSSRSARLAAGLGLVLSTWAAPIAAQEDDGMYGRMEGDATVRAALGSALGGGAPSAALEAGLSYLRTAGMFFRYADALGGDADPFQRSISAGAEVSPLFLARMANDLEQGPALLDLTLDSLALGVGAFWHRDARGWSADPGFELTASVDVPFVGSATGPFVGARGTLRWGHVDLAGRGRGDTFDRGSALLLVLGWQHVVRLGIADVGDSAVR